MNRPIYDCFDSYYKSPFGAVERTTGVTFRLNLPADIPVSECTLVMFRPGFKEKFILLENQGISEENGEKFSIFTGIYSPQDTGLHHYYFMLTVSGSSGHRYIKRVGASLGGFDDGDLFQLTVYEEGMTTPDWMKGGVMYQIFPDRFAKSADTENKPEIPSDRRIHADWNDIPDWMPDEKGMITNNDFFGGNLKGIEEKLPYLKSLGVTCIYLNPIFEAHENHRYCTACYERIDSLLGTEEDFKRLCSHAGDMGIKIILDGVFSHTGADSVYFNKFGRYGEKSGAFRDPESPYREWYSFINYPNEYESWWGITTLPNVNENNPEYTKYICGEGGILQRWIDAGAAGWRLDVADELPDEFLDNLKISVKSKGEDKIIYGEVWEDASNKESYGVRRRYLTGKQLDSVMNYPFKECILNYVKYSDAKQLVDGVMTIIEHYPKPCVDILMNFLSTHDTERAITRLAGEDVGWHDRQWQSEHKLSSQEYVYGTALLKCAMVLQFFLPGVPCIYYGDEAGQEGYKDPFNRRTYPWGNEDDDLVAFVAELGRIRKNGKMFAKGTMRFTEATSDYCIFRREDREQGVAAVIYLNKSSKARNFLLHETIGECCGFHVIRQQNREQGKIHVSPYDYEVVFVRLDTGNNAAVTREINKAQPMAQIPAQPSLKTYYRSFTESDIRKVINLYISYYNTNQHRHWTEKVVHKRLWQTLNREDSFGIVAENENGVVGFALGYFEQYDSGVAYDLAELVISGEYQDKGEGVALMQELERRVKAEGAFIIQLESVNDEKNNRFYENLGYRNRTDRISKSKIL